MRAARTFVVFPELALTTFFPRYWMEEPGGDRPLLRAIDAECRDAAAVRPGATVRHRLLPRLRRADAGGRALQHRDPRRSRRPYRGSLPQDPPAGPCGPQAAGAVPAPGEALLPGGQRRLQGLAHDGLADRHVHLQRPALAGNVSRDGTAGRGGGGPRLQHAVAQHPLARTAASADVPPPACYCRPMRIRMHCGWARRANVVQRTAFT